MMDVAYDLLFTDKYIQYTQDKSDDWIWVIVGVVLGGILITAIIFYIVKKKVK